jgi:hypothetical protein
MTMLYPNALALALGIGLAFCCGCQERAGSGRYALAGTVAMPDGAPVPAGEINFEPDSGSGNQGPGSMTQIKDGKYSLPKDRGIVGGKYIVTILPFDGISLAESPQGKPLRNAPYSQQLELPAKDSTRDFKIAK